MVVEYASETKVRPVDTGYRNIKITTPEDLLIAEALLRSRTDRTGPDRTEQDRITGYRILEERL